MSDLSDLYQEVILDHNRRPRNFHALADASHTAEGYNPLCGDRLTLYLKVADGVISDVAFEGAGCAISKASASMMTVSPDGDDAPRSARRGHGQAVVAGGRARVPGPREVRQPGLAYAQGSYDAEKSCVDRVETPVGLDL